MKLIAMPIDEAGDTIAINPAHIVQAKRITPPVTELTLSTGLVLQVRLALDQLLAEFELST